MASRHPPNHSERAVEAWNGQFSLDRPEMPAWYPFECALESLSLFCLFISSSFLFLRSNNRA